MDLMYWDCDNNFVFNSKDSRLGNLDAVYDGIVLILNSKTHCFEVASALNPAAQLFQGWIPIVLFFFCDFFCRSGL